MIDLLLTKRNMDTVGGKTFSKEELYDRTPRVYKRDASQVRFLLGGIGTGNFSVDARGKFLDWEIFNWPAKNTKFPLSFFAIRVENKKMDQPVSKILESRLLPPYTSSHGYLQAELVNLPRMEDSSLVCEYPFAQVNFQDGELPVEVSLEAFTPFIPLNAEDSGIPCGIIRYKVKNKADCETRVSLVGTLPNASGFEGYDVIENLKLAGSVKNEYRQSGKVKGLYYSPVELSEDHLRYGNMAIMMNEENVTYKTEWFDGEWVDGIQDFWDDFTRDGLLEKETKSESVGCEFAQFHNFSFLKRREKIGSIGTCQVLKPGEERTFEFVISWYFPNRVKAWIEFDEDYDKFAKGEYGTVRNHYASRFKNAWDVGEYVYQHMERLEKGSRDFQKAMFHKTTFPYYVIDALTANITNLRSNLCFWLEDGTFAGFEGIRDYIGCGYGSVPHVWNYEQTVAFLFPELEKTMRNVEFLQETDEEGCMSTRMFSVFDQERYKMVPACDGELGSIVRIYRDFKNLGDVEFLRKIWPKASAAMDYSMRQWDLDHDGVLDGQQNTTYDIEFYGPNPMTDSIFLAALKCCVEMADILGDVPHKDKYEEVYQKGKLRADELMFNGEYYIQVQEEIDKYKYQFGKGCLSDQLLGQFLAHMAGIGNILPEDHIRSAMKAVFKYNYMTDFYHTDSVHRAYALNEERGLVIATWPEGGRPKFPLSYAGEVWTGIEYETAVNLIYAGCLEEGLTIIKSVRDRYDGYKRNPFSEVESGHHYSRAMASWGVLNALLGQKSDMYRRTLSFHPVIDEEELSSFFICGKAWGVYSQKKVNGKLEKTIDVLYGTLDGITIEDQEA